jgi:hypothetical protein
MEDKEEFDESYRYDPSQIIEYNRMEEPIKRSPPGPFCEGPKLTSLTSNKLVRWSLGEET